MSADKPAPFLSAEYFAHSANVLSAIAAKLDVARECLDAAVATEHPGDELARVSAELRHLVDIAQRGSDIARRMASFNVTERERVRTLLRQSTAGPNSGDASLAKEG